MRELIKLMYNKKGVRFLSLTPLKRFLQMIELKTTNNIKFTIDNEDLELISKYN